MYSRTIEDYKKTLALTDEQKEIIIGTLLGDGHLETRNGRTYRLKIEHSIKQRDYVDWLYASLKEWVLTPPQEKIKKREDVTSANYWFTTVSSGSFRFYAQQFYGKDGVKKVPKLIHRWITPRALAVWFMDDGSMKSRTHRARIINTHSFTKQDIGRLCTILQEKYQILCIPRKQKDGIQMMILAESAQKFADLISPYMHPSMRYKLKGLE